MDISGFVKAEAKKVEGHFKYDIYKWLVLGAGGIMLGVIYAIYQKIRNLSVDWYIVGGLFVLSFVMYFAGMWMFRRSEKPNEAKEALPNTNGQHPISVAISTASLSDLTESLVTDTGMEVGLTFDWAEMEISPDNSPQPFKCKLWIYWMNDSDEIIHLGVPLLRGITIQGNDLAYTYQLRQPWNAAKPWGDFTKETDVKPGQRCRIWLGLDPALRDKALKLLEAGQLGLLIVPVTISKRTVDVCIRPRDRGLRQIAVKEFGAVRRSLSDIYTLFGHELKAALSFVRVRRLVSLRDIEEHFQQYHLADAQKVITALGGEPIAFLTLTREGHVVLNPVLEKIITEIVTADEADFLDAVGKASNAVIQERVKEPGFKGRYDALVSRQPSRQ